MERLSLLGTLRELEGELHQPECRSDRERLAQLLAPDFREFGRSGATYTHDDELPVITRVRLPTRLTHLRANNQNVL